MTTISPRGRLGGLSPASLLPEHWRVAVGRHGIPASSGACRLERCHPPVHRSSRITRHQYSTGFKNTKSRPDVSVYQVIFVRTVRTYTKEARVQFLLTCARQCCVSSTCCHLLLLQLLLPGLSSARGPRLQSHAGSGGNRTSLLWASHALSLSLEMLSSPLLPSP